MTARNFDRRLLNFSLFSTLDSERDFEELFAFGQPFSVDAGMELFRQGDKANGMYAIHEGEIAIRLRVPGDTAREISRVGPGGFVGELALLDHRPRSASALAVQPTSGYFFGEHFFTLLREAGRPVHRKVMHTISLVICVRIREQIANIARGVAAGGGRRNGLPVMVGPSREPVPLLNLDTSVSLDIDRDGPLTVGLPFFERFELSEISTIAKACRRIDVARMQTIYLEGSHPAHCFLILRGAARIGVARNGWSEPCATLGPGQVLGAVGVLDGQPHPTDATAREETTLLVISRDALVRFCQGSSTAGAKLSAALIETLVSELRGVDRNVSRLDAQGLLQE